jgi:hypothetical protein
MRGEVPSRLPSARISGVASQLAAHDWPLLTLSIALQLVLGLLFGHAYDMRIFMSAGYLVATGQNPYLPQDLSSIFHNPSFAAITTVGYPPPWPLVLGLIYRLVYAPTSNFLLDNLAIKIPIIAANLILAYLAASALKRLGASDAAARKAWIFVLLNPFLLYASAAWGQFDSIVAVLSLAALLLLDSGKVKSSAILLALAVSFKPIAIPLLPVPFFYLRMEAPRHIFHYYAVLVVSTLVFFVAPFPIFGWDPSPILQHWNAHFVVGGGLSWLTFLEFVQGSYILNGDWWLLGLVWLPALGVASLALRPGITGLKELFSASAAMIMVFFLTRAWLSEPNIILVLPLVLILTLTGHLDRLALHAIWILPLIFGIVNTSAAQLFFPSMPAVMDKLLRQMQDYRTARLIAKVIVVIPWELVGWRIVLSCLRRATRLPGGFAATGSLSGSRIA